MKLMTLCSEMTANICTKNLMCLSVQQLLYNLWVHNFTWKGIKAIERTVGTVLLVLEKNNPEDFPLNTGKKNWM